MDRMLMDYLPEIMKEYEEFKQIMPAEQKCTEALWQAVEELTREGFVQEETETGARRWESILEIKPKDTDSLEVRNFRITGRLNESLPYTFRIMERQLRALCGEGGFQMDLMNNSYTLVVRVALKSKALKTEVDSLADRIVPVNLILDIELMYNTYRMLRSKTYGMLKDYTHFAIREEVFEKTNPLNS